MDRSNALQRDVSLVLPNAQALSDVATNVTVSALIKGRESDVDAAIARAVELINASVAPAFVGASQLTVEAVSEAITVTRKMRGRLIVGNDAPDPVVACQPVTFTGTLDRAMHADLVVAVGVDTDDTTQTAGNPIVQRIVETGRHGISCEATLEAVLQVRDYLSHDGPHNAVAGAIADATTATIMLLAGRCDSRVTGQWHKLACDVQQRHRVSVITVPDPAMYANTRGAMEVMTWRTGVYGNVDFADGAARPCTADIANCDVSIGAVTGSPVAARIAIGPQPVRDAEVCFVTPGLSLGLVARVMRFDGAVLWLHTEPAVSPPDPTVDLLKRLTDAIEAPNE